MNRDALGDRMKAYENIERKYLTRRLPCIIRIDGCHFHSYTKGFDKPFDVPFHGTMAKTTIELCKNIQGVKCAYTQSDEISLLLTDYDTLETAAWFDKNVQKMVSVSAAMATYFFNKYCEEYRPYLSDSHPFMLAHDEKIAVFDARAFVLPKEEVTNYFYWRQIDARRNAIQMTAQSLFSHKEIQGISNNELIEKMKAEKDIDFYLWPEWFQNGTFIERNNNGNWVAQSADWFGTNRDMIEKYVHVGE